MFLPKMLDSYHVKPEPIYLYYPTAIALVAALPSNVAQPSPDVGEPACIIVQPTDTPGALATVLNGLPRRFPGFVGQEFRDPSGQRVAFLFAPPK